MALLLVLFLNTFTFSGKIVEVNKHSFKVTCWPRRAVYDIVSYSSEKYLTVGDSVRITFNGEVLEHVEKIK